jgi:hypothetical protein
MNCKKYQNLITLYAQDELSPDEKKLLEEHMKECPTCTQVLKRERIMTESIDWDSQNLPKPDWKASLRVISTQPQKDEKRWKRLVIQTAAVVAVFIIGSLIGKHVLFPVKQAEEITAFSPLQRYFSEVRPALTVFMNTSMDQATEYETEMEKKIIKEMLIDTRFLKKGVYEQDNPYLQKLFDELEIILIEISNLKYGDEQSKKMIVEMIKEKGMPFKLKALDTDGSYSF